MLNCQENKKKNEN